ncbi:3'-5' exonuclease [Candidatus Parcubacteria bacterium]|nr:3'-5' exonuclease [Candidatus Parcubacteria bacterium]
MRNVLIIDTETNGLDPNKGAKVIEVGAMLYSVEHKVVLQNISTFLPCDINPVEDINNIKAEWTQERVPVEASIQMLKWMGKSADAYVAHNAEFDKRFLRTINGLDGEFWSKKWICTKRDFKWPVQLFRQRLQDVCAAMGVTYADAHRALIDCHFIAMCFSKVDDLEQRLINATQNTFGKAGSFR